MVNEIRGLGGPSRHAPHSSLCHLTTKTLQPCHIVYNLVSLESGTGKEQKNGEYSKLGKSSAVFWFRIIRNDLRTDRLLLGAVLFACVCSQRA